MKKTDLLFLIFALLMATLTSNADWLKSVNSSGANNSGTFGSTLVTLSDGDCIVGGQYKADQVILDDLSFSAISSASKLVTQDRKKAFIVRMAADGKFVWCVPFGSKGEDENLLLKMKVDNKDNVYILGTASSPLTWNGAVAVNKTTTKRPYAFLLKIAPDGTFLWSKVIEYYNTAEDISFDINNLGEIVVATTVTQLERKITQDKITYNRPGSHTSAVIMLFDTMGNCVWIKGGVSAGAGSASTAKDVYLGDDGNIFITGEYMAGYNTTGVLSFSDKSVAFPVPVQKAPACGCVFICKYNREGICQFVSNAGSNLSAGNQKPKAFGIAIDGDKIYVTGRFHKEFAVWSNDGNTKLNEIKNSAQSSFYLLEFDNDGSYKKTISGEATSCYVEIQGLKKTDNSWLLVGNFAGNIKLDENTRFVSTKNRMVSRQKFFPFIFKYDANMNFVDGYVPEANAETRLLDFAVFGNNVTAVGSFNEDVTELDFKGTKVNPTKGYHKAFIWKFAE